MGGVFPNSVYPFGKIGNKIRCFCTKHIVKSMGKNCIIDRRADIKEDVVLHDYANVGSFCRITKGAEIKGHNMMAANVRVYTQNHYYDAEQHKFQGYTEVRPVIIGEYTWIGYGVVVLPGVVIGDHTIIGACSVVTKNIPSGVMAAGNPCTVKKIIDPEYYDGPDL